LQDFAIFFENQKAKNLKMWYEMLPHLGFMLTFATIPASWYPRWSLFIRGNQCCRNQDVLHIERFYQRDQEITGSAYIVKGLECIPDE